MYVYAQMHICTYVYVAMCTFLEVQCKQIRNKECGIHATDVVDHQNAILGA